MPFIVMVNTASGLCVSTLLGMDKKRRLQNEDALIQFLVVVPQPLRRKFFF